MLSEYIPSILDTIFQVIIENLPVIQEASYELIIALTEGLIEMIPTIIETVLGMVDVIAETITETDWSEVGGQIIAGMQKGFDDGVAALLESVVDAGQSMLDAVTDLFDIHSPSRVMEDIFYHVPEGGAVGVKKGAGLLEDEINALLPTELENKLSASITPNFSSNSTVSVNHFGVIRVEGVNTQGELIGVVEIVKDQLKMEAMFAGTP